MFQNKRIISSKKWLNYVVTFFFIWFCRTTVNEEKKGDGLKESMATYTMAAFSQEKKKEKRKEKEKPRATIGHG